MWSHRATTCEYAIPLATKVFLKLHYPRAAMLHAVTNDAEKLYVCSIVLNFEMIFVSTLSQCYLQFTITPMLSITSSCIISSFVNSLHLFLVSK